MPHNLKSILALELFLAQFDSGNYGASLFNLMIMGLMEPSGSESLDSTASCPLHDNAL